MQAGMIGLGHRGSSKVWHLLNADHGREGAIPKGGGA